MNFTAFMSRCALLAALCILPAQAYETTIHAEYRPGANGQQNIDFTDITECRGYWCGHWGQNKILQLNTFIDRTVRRSANPREQVYLRFPGSRNVTVQQENGSSANLTFTLTDIGGIYRRNSNNQPHLFQLSEDLNFPDTGSSCGRSGFNSVNGATDTAFLWNINAAAQQNGGQCTRALRSQYSGSYGITQRHLIFKYRLNTPDPLKMDNGIYRGKLVFSVGPNGDFDFGDGSYDENEVVINFELSVGHQSLFRFPAGSEQAVLQPAAGWTQYLTTGRVPDRVYQDIPFRLWNSVPIAVYLQCEHQKGQDCALKNTKQNHLVPVKSSLSLPRQLAQQNGTAVNRVQLRQGQANQLLFKANSTVLNGAGELHFEVQQTALTEMLSGYRGDLYKGDVTLVIESQLPD
ncbi:hypothetical protein [Rheinheimera sp. 1928-s]|uniref:hypothetical protein n=1 Tax=Rheinheimera sp. 1928-s TaxID=3033803 RepID=UPI00261C195C|nr:hypothetical protein [Rheinheimera sp. 1928-s]MDF3126548.1 hypothetical protein [Rheinheimera sp. 1928-s]